MTTGSLTSRARAKLACNGALPVVQEVQHEAHTGLVLDEVELESDPGAPLASGDAANDRESAGSSSDGSAASEEDVKDNGSTSRDAGGAGAGRADLHAQLRDKFLAYARFGTRRPNARTLDVFRFMKLCRECALLGRPSELGAIDLVFYKVRPPRPLSRLSFLPTRSRKVATLSLAFGTNQRF